MHKDINKYKENAYTIIGTITLKANDEKEIKE